MEAPLMELFPDDISDAGSSISTTSQSSKKKRRSRFSHIKSKVDTNLTEERKKTLPSKVVVPRFVVSSPKNNSPENV